MTLPADIAAIAARHDIAYSDRRHSIVKAFKNAHNDRGALLRAYRELAQELAEHRKIYAGCQLIEERDRLRVCITKLQDGTATVDVPQAECDRLRASNAKLQRALRDICKSEGPDSLSLEDWQGLTLRLQRKAMAALADAQHPEQQPAQEQP